MGLALRVPRQPLAEIGRGPDEQRGAARLVGSRRFSLFRRCCCCSRCRCCRGGVGCCFRGFGFSFQSAFYPCDTMSGAWTPLTSARTRSRTILQTAGMQPSGFPRSIRSSDGWSRVLTHRATAGLCRDRGSCRLGSPVGGLPWGLWAAPWGPGPEYRPGVWFLRPKTSRWSPISWVVSKWFVWCGLGRGSRRSGVLRGSPSAHVPLSKHGKVWAVDNSLKLRESSSQRPVRPPLISCNQRARRDVHSIQCVHCVLLVCSILSRVTAVFTFPSSTQAQSIDQGWRLSGVHSSAWPRTRSRSRRHARPRRVLRRNVASPRSGESGAIGFVPRGK